MFFSLKMSLEIYNHRYMIERCQDPKHVCQRPICNSSFDGWFEGFCSLPRVESSVDW